MKLVLSLSISVFVLAVASGGPVSAGDKQFGGNECTVDCSGHAAGYRWAEDNEIRSELDCPSGHGSSFEEGCRTFVEDPYRGADEDDDGEEIE